MIAGNTNGKKHQMSKKYSVRVVALLGFVLFAGLMSEGCNLGKKNCGCGMDLNGAVKKKHRLF